LHNCTQGFAKHRLEFRDRRRGLSCGADRDDHDRNVDVAAEEARALPLPVFGAVDAEKH
jgi:hypothetical protein